MSLINEALKKAQRQRMENPASVPPPVDGSAASSSHPIATRRPPMPARTQVLVLGGCIVLLFMGGLMAFLFLAPGSPTPSPLKSPQAAVPPAKQSASIASASVTLAPAAERPPVTTPEITITLPLIKPVAVVATPPAAPVPGVPAPTTAQVAAATSAQPAKPASSPDVPAVPTANPKVYEFLETLRVAGIRVSATDPKVILNDRVFRINDVVDRNTQLRLTKVGAASLTFTDPSGFEYQKSF